MSPKNAIKMINIQKFYSVYFGPILSSSVHFSSIQSILVLFGAIGPHLFYYVHFSLIQSTMVLFGPFCPLRSYLVDIGLIRSTLVLFVPILSIMSTLVLIYLFVLIRSPSILSVHIGPLYFIWST